VEIKNKIFNEYLLINDKIHFFQIFSKDMNTGHFRPMLHIRRVVEKKKDFYSKSKKGKIELRICNDQKHIN